MSSYTYSLSMFDQAINLSAKPAMFNANVLAFMGSVILFANISHAEAVYIKDFSIDRTEVTVGSFAEYSELEGILTQAEKEGGGYEWAAGWKRRSGWTYKSPQGKLAAFDEPVVHVTWDEASAYCAYKGGRLPTRDEWILSAFTELRDEPHGGISKGNGIPISCWRYSNGHE
jgi:sulfatase modifying factor 1